MAVTITVIKGGATKGLKRLFADPEHVLQIIAQAKDQSLSEVQRQYFTGMLRGFKSFYRQQGKHTTVAYLDRELKEINAINRAASDD